MKYKENLIKTLAKLARIDENFCEEEVEIINNIAKKENIEEKDTYDYINDLSEFDTILPKDDLSKKQYLNYLVKVMLVDGIIDIREYNMCKEIAKKMELDDNAVDILIKENGFNYNENKEIDE